MSEMGPNKTDINGILQGLRREFSRQAEQAGTIEAIAGGPVDRDLPLDYWRFGDTDLENELWSRIPDLDRAMLDLGQAIDILPSALCRNPVCREKSKADSKTCCCAWPCR